MADRQRGEPFASAVEERIRADQEHPGRLWKGGEGVVDFRFGARSQDMKLQPESESRSLEVSRHRLGTRVVWIDEERNERRRGEELVRELQPFRRYLDVQLGHAGDVAAGSAKARDQAELHRIAAGGKNDGNRIGRSLCDDIGRSAGRGKDRDLAMNKVASQCG